MKVEWKYNFPSRKLFLNCKAFISQIGAVKFTLFKGALFIHEDDVKKCAKNTVAERAQRAVTSENTRQ